MTRHPQYQMRNAKHFGVLSICAAAADEVVMS